MSITNTKIQLTAIVLAVVLSLAYLGNQRTFVASKPAGAKTNRMPASVGSIVMSSTAREQLEYLEENDLAEEVAIKSPKRSMASVGQAASEMDSLRFGLLEGKYAFKMRDNKITAIEISDEQSDHPVSIGNRQDFLNKYAKEFGAIDKVQRLSSVSKGENLIETYRIKLAHGPDRILEMTLGPSNSLLSLKNEEAPPSLRLF